MFSKFLCVLYVAFGSEHFNEVSFVALKYLCLKQNLNRKYNLLR